MKNLRISLIVLSALFVLAAPVSALAAGTAKISNVSISPNCSVRTTGSVVKSGERVTVIWKSVGADSMTGLTKYGTYPANGRTSLTIMGTPGTQLFTLVFKGPDATVVCKKLITILP